MRHDCFDMGGTFRARSVEDTLDWIKPKLSALGITRTAHITGLDDIGLSVVICMRPMAKHLSVSQGKGISEKHAEVSAIMESVEVFHIENPPKVDLIGNIEVLSDNHSLASLSEFLPGVFSWSAQENNISRWIKAKELNTDKIIFIPHGLVNLDSTQIRKDFALFHISTNGLAAGNNLEEALCHALYEVIERHSLTIWAALPACQAAQTLLDLASISDEINLRLLDDLTRHWPIKVWEITSEIGIPTYHAALFSQDKIRSIVTGTGTHLSKKIALSRALTEVAQARLAIISGSRDDVLPSYYDDIKHGVLLKHSFQKGMRQYTHCRDFPIQQSMKLNRQLILDLLSKCGYQKAYMVDHTKKGLDIPVVQVFVPGLEFNQTRM